MSGRFLSERDVHNHSGGCVYSEDLFGFTAAFSLSFFAVGVSFWVHLSCRQRSVTGTKVASNDIGASRVSPRFGPNSHRLKSLWGIIPKGRLIQWPTTGALKHRQEALFTAGEFFAARTPIPAPDGLMWVF